MGGVLALDIARATRVRYDPLEGDSQRQTPEKGMAVLPSQHGLKVFISYSRSDREFVQQLVLALEALGHAITIDTIDILGAELWKERLSQMIRDADTIVFVLSPASARSEVCTWEVEQALNDRKRIVPIVARPLDEASPHEALKKLNFIFFCSQSTVAGAGWGAGLAALHAILSVDVEWIRDHTRLTGMAAQWDAQAANDDLLLRGSELAKFQKWRDHRPINAPETTALQRKFLEASEWAQQARNDAERKQLELIHQSQNEREQALRDKSKAQEDRASALNLVWRRTLIGIISCSVFFVGLLAAMFEVSKRGKINEAARKDIEQARQRIEDEQNLFGRVLSLTSNPAIPSDSSDLGILARRYEGGSSKHIGTDFDGGRYYGVYRIKAGRQMDYYMMFLRQYYSDLHKRLSIDVAQPGHMLDSAWLSLAEDAAHKERFALSQAEFIEQTSYTQLLRGLEGKVCTKPDGTQVNLKTPILLNIPGRSKALQQVLFSIAVQFGPETCLVHDALGNLPDLTKESDSDIIRLLYRTRNNIGGYFPRVEQTSQNFATLIKMRNKLELRDALLLLDR
jgi:cbb3-type cytochrome oxidase subunit 3